MNNVYPFQPRLSTKKSSKSEKNDVKSQPMDIADKKTKNNNFIQVPAEFFRAGFDSETYLAYSHILYRAANNKNGFFEKIDNTAEKMRVSVRQLKYCRKLLEFCNIISMTKRYDPKNHNRQTSTLIMLIDKQHWNLNHEWRDCGKFGKRNDKIDTKPIKKTPTPKRISKKSAVHTVHPPSAHSAPPPVHTVHTELDHDPNQITSEPDHIGGGEKKSASSSSGLKHGYATTLLADMLTLVFKGNRKYYRYPNEDADEIVSGIIKQTDFTKNKIIQVWEIIIKNNVLYPDISPSMKNDKKVIEADFVSFIQIIKGEINE